MEPTSASVIRRIFAEARAGSGTKEITTRLNSEGAQSPGGKRWGKSTVHAILTNPVYKGTLKFGAHGRYHSESGLEPIIVEGAVPAIIESQVFDALQAALAARAPQKAHPRTVGGRYLLSGLLRCGKCGASMFGHGAKSGKYHYYICTTANRSGKFECDEPPVPQELIETGVVDRLLHVVLAEPNVMRLVELTNEYLAESNRVSEEALKSIESELRNVRSRLLKLYEAIETDEVSIRDLAPRIKQLRAQEEDLIKRESAARERTKRNLASKVETTAVLAQLQDLKGLLESGSPVQRKQFLMVMVKKVTKTGTQIRIEYSLPLPPDDSDLNQDRVPPTVLAGGPKGTISRTFEVEVPLAA